MGEQQTEIPEPPEHLSARSQELWRALVPKRAKSPGRLALLQAGLEALDRSDQARELLSAQELTSVTSTTGAIHLNPLAKLEQDSRAEFMRAWRQLNFDRDVKIEGGW